MSKHSNILCVALALTTAIPALADEVKTVQVFGEAAIVQGDDQQTEKNVKRDARRKAAESGAGVLVTSNSLVRNFQLVSDEVMTQSKGVIVDEVWGPMQKSDGVAKIKLDAKVSKDALEDAVCTVVKANHDPKIAMVFVEKYGDDGQPWKVERGLVEALFVDAFKNSCFTLVEPGVKVVEITASGDLPQETIDAIVKNSRAQYVVLGQGKLIKSLAQKSVLSETAMNSYSISASVKLVNTSTNEIEAAATSSQQILGISPENALKAPPPKNQSGTSTGTKAGIVVDSVMKEVLDKVTHRWSSDLMNASKVQVVVENVPNYQAAKALRELIEKSFQGAKVAQRNVSKGIANFDVDVEGGADELAAKLEGKKAGKWTVEVKEVDRGKVVLNLKQ
jgi:hypothetical protein